MKPEPGARMAESSATRGVASDASPVSSPVSSSMSPSDASSDASSDVSSSSVRSGRSADGTYEVHWEPVGGIIPDADPFAIAVAVRRIDGQPLSTDAVVRVDAEMPHHGHGMNLVPVVKRQVGASRFLAEGMLFHMTGRWVLSVDVEEAGVSERAQWFVDIE